MTATVALAACAATAAAGNDTDELQRRWAVIAGMNLSCPTMASVERSPRDAGNIAAFASPQCNVLLEYYLPQQHFSLVGGYNAETVQWFGSEVDATMQNIVVGARYYPLNKRFALQPYASLMTYTNVAGRHVRSSMSVWNAGDNYERNITISLPRVSAAPTVGVDCYIFSSLALEFQYGFPLCSIGDAIKNHPDLVREYLGSVVPYRDNFFAALNSAVFSDGSFVYIPKGVRCPMELSSYFRINARNTGQFERTLIIADDDAYVSYLEGCTAPMRDENQLHAAIVEIVVKDNAEVKYSTVQNWYPGDENGKGGVLNLVTKRGDLRGVNSKLSWTQVETGSAITWKYPSCVLRGDGSQAEFYSVAVTNNYQEADTGTKMIHMGKNTKSTIISKGISAGHSQNSYRGLVRATSNADNARNYSSCDSLLLGSDCGAHTFPYMDIHNDTAVVEHEATTSKISEDQLFYCNQRGIPTEQAVGLIVNGYAKDVLNKLPMEFAVEAQKLLSVSLEGTVG